MSLRHLARQIVVQSLFTWDFYNQDSERVDEFFQWNIDRHERTIVEEDFPRSCYQGVIKKVEVIDQIIAKAAPQWPIERIAPVDRNILRLGIYEMLFTNKKDVPPRVAINEAIELGKSFGGPNSYKFISGVLGSVYEASDLKEGDTYQKGNEDPAKFPVVKKIGSIIYAEGEEGELYFGMVHDIFGKWTLSKGGALEEETDEEACRRSTKKEVGLEVVVEGQIEQTEYIARHPEMGKLRKQVTYYLCRSDYVPMHLEEKNDGLTKAEWFTPAQVEQLETYDDIKPLIFKALKQLKQ